MNYQAVYEALIDRAKRRDPPELCERHHAIPKCLGGSDDKSNIVRLTPREHFFVPHGGYVGGSSGEANEPCQARRDPEIADQRMVV